MHENRSDARRIFIKPGEAYISRSPIQIITVLGSCVGTIFYAPRTGLGAMSHAMYPEMPRNSKALADTFYVDRALELMLARFGKEGLSPEEIKAYVFGGGSMIHGCSCKDEGRSGIGKDNYHSALDTLRRLGITQVWNNDACTKGQRLVLDLADHRIYLENLAERSPKP